MVRLGFGLGLELVIWLWLGLWLGLRVRVRVMVRVRVGFMVRVGVRVRIMVNLTLTLELNLNRLSYWDCCRNMVRKKKLLLGRAWASNQICGPGLGLNFRPVQGPSTHYHQMGI